MRLKIIEQIRATAASLGRPTMMSVAFMRAAGLPVRPAAIRPGVIYPAEAFYAADAEIAECFANHGSPMNLVL